MTSNDNPEVIGPSQPEAEPLHSHTPVAGTTPQRTFSRRMLAGISAGTLIVGLLIGGGAGIAVGSAIAPATTTSATVPQDETGFPGTPPGMGTVTPPDMGTGTPPGVGTDSESDSTTGSGTTTS